MAPSSAGDTATLSGRDGRAHYALVLAFGALAAEGRLFERAAGGAVEERGRDLLARRVLRVGLHDPAACLRDQVQGPLDPIATSPSKTSAACDLPSRTRNSPLCFSHSRANASQVSVLSGLIVYSLTARLSTGRTPAAAKR